MAQDGRSQGGGGLPGCNSGGSSPSQGRSSPPAITLSVPRPENQRANNLYVDTPFKHRVAHSAPQTRRHGGSSGSGSRSSSPRATPQDLPLVHGLAHPRTLPHGHRKPAHHSKSNTLQNTSLSSPSTPTTGKSNTLKKSNTLTSGSISSALSSPSSVGSRTPVISKQPAALTFTKGGNSRDDLDGESIICTWCGRCRCQACTTPRPPPAAWLCRDKCLCSPAAAVDYASCLCCVKGVLYHCGKDGEVGSIASAADHPCGCGGSHVMLRWACLAVAAVPLPCLLCYWPLTGLRKLTEGCYQRCTSHGCRCPQGRSCTTPEKRPLHEPV